MLRTIERFGIFILLGLILLAPIQEASAHCDTMDGPVIMDAKKALDAKNIAPALKWVRAEDEPEIKSTFNHVLAIRSKGEDVRRLADQYFFETLVRVHREGEGAPYAGIKPAGTPVSTGVQLADDALEKNAVRPVIDHITQEVISAIKVRFHKVVETKSHAEESVKDGREFVKAYVEWTHFIENVAQTVAGQSIHHHAETEDGEQHIHQEP